jgi:hypothetical protein
VIDRLLSHIPRVEAVRSTLLYLHKGYDGSGTPADELAGHALPFGARLLRVAHDYVRLSERGGADTALERMQRRGHLYDPRVIAALAEVLRYATSDAETVAVRLVDARMGMITAREVRSTQGAVLLPKGEELSAGMLERLRHHAAGGGIEEPLHVRVPRAR